MKAQINDNKSQIGKEGSHKQIGQNPISAINKLKSIKNNVQMMRNRQLVLKRRDQSIKYKTLNQEKKLNHHQAIHQRLTKQREQLRQSLQQINDTKELRERSEQIRRQIKEGTASARMNIYNNNLQRYQQITQEASKHKQTININKQSDFISAKEKATSLKKIKQLEKESIQKKLQEKVSRILVSKSIDCGEIQQKSSHDEKIIQKLQKNQMEMIRQASKSMQNSKIVSRRFTQIMMNLPSFKAKKAQKTQSEGNSFLPSIKQNNSNNKTLQLIIV